MVAGRSGDAAPRPAGSCVQPGGRFGRRRRIQALAILQSMDGAIWTQLHLQNDTFGGVDGCPLIWTGAEPVRLRYLRLAVEARLAFGLDQVQVFGPVSLSTVILSFYTEDTPAELVRAQRAILTKFAAPDYRLRWSRQRLPPRSPWPLCDGDGGGYHPRDEYRLCSDPCARPGRTRWLCRPGGASGLPGARAEFVRSWRFLPRLLQNPLAGRRRRIADGRGDG